jgi:hypothetical protein
LDDTVLEPNDTFYQTIPGLGNMTVDPTFYGAPVFLSKANFLDVPEEYINRVEGISPNRSRDDVFLDVEPISGASKLSIYLATNCYRYESLQQTPVELFD